MYSIFEKALNDIKDNINNEYKCQEILAKLSLDVSKNFDLQDLCKDILWERPSYGN